MKRSPDQQLDDIFRDFAQQVQEDYPALKDAFILLDSRRWKIFKKFDISKFDGLTRTDFDKQLEYRQNNAIHASNSSACRIYYRVNGKTTGVGGMIIYGHAHSADCGLVSIEKPQGIYYILYHELGHLMVKDACGSSTGMDTAHGNYKESAADVYSLIRLHKHFGRDACIEQAKKLVETRANSLINRSIHHFTTPAVRAFMKHMDDIDFNTLTLDDAGALARHFALEHALPTSRLVKLRDKFNEYCEDVWIIPRHDAQKSLVEKVIASNDPLFAAAAHAYLRQGNAAPNLVKALRLHDTLLAKADVQSGMSLKNAAINIPLLPKIK